MSYSTRSLAKLLEEGRFLTVNVELAVAVGFNEALILTQLHFWLQKKKNKKNGRYWVYNTLSDWHRQFPFMSLATLKRAMKNLADKELILRDRFNKLRNDRTTWYSIGYKKTVEVAHIELDDRLTMSQWSSPERANGLAHDEPMLPYKEDTKKEDTKNTTESAADAAKPRGMEKKGREKEDPTVVKPISGKDISAKHLKALSQRKKVTTTSMVEMWTVLTSMLDIKRFSFTKKERGMAKNLIKWLGEVSDINPLEFLSYAVENWDTLYKAIRWDDSKKPRLPKDPRFEHVFYAKEDILDIINRGGKTKAEVEKKRKTIIYTDMSQVPKDHPQFGMIEMMIKMKGEAKIVE